MAGKAEAKVGALKLKGADQINTRIAQNLAENAILDHIVKSGVGPEQGLEFKLGVEFKLTKSPDEIKPVVNPKGPVG